MFMFMKVRINLSPDVTFPSVFDNENGWDYSNHKFYKYKSVYLLYEWIIPVKEKTVIKIST